MSFLYLEVGGRGSELRHEAMLRVLRVHVNWYVRLSNNTWCSRRVRVIPLA